MSQPVSIPTEVNDFFSSFYRQSEQSLGKLASNSYATVPLEPDKTLDEYVEKSKAAKQAQAQAQAPAVYSTPVNTPDPTPPITSTPTSASMSPAPVVQQSADNTDKAQKLAMWLPRGAVPKGYTVSVSCANCEYFCGGYSEGRGVCTKFDFACSINYTCDEFELMGSNSETESETEVYSAKEEPQVLSDSMTVELQSTVTEPTYVGDTFLTVEEAQLHERLRAIAEKRVSLIATKEGRAPLIDEVEKELDRILKARLTPKTT